ncbi:MAG: DUF2782 domain-containing protein [Magnetococcales bacterium]|nr:DUF2782 domain-containing protein [Magnetococcales bacterium]MBF0150989.1 DUF2782 domain-containing protein [Magnetococcales bacterium]MBF0347118.1 DUF2782 domain-containing protein [Magnetococcales bacterium]MBF0629499.1 DUF2782 domain-containing protein [Magnetococcales bacterium]
MPYRFRPEWIRSWRLLSPVLLSLLTVMPARADEPVVLEKGHAIPHKGAMVTRFREDLSPELDGPETIVRKYEDEQGNQVLEFVINGSLFQLQVIPANGVPYLLIDTNGDGLFDSKFHGHEPRLVVPQWVFFRF